MVRAVAGAARWGEKIVVGQAEPAGGYERCGTVGHVCQRLGNKVNAWPQRMNHRMAELEELKKKK